jgi:hypothetical protein
MSIVPDPGVEQLIRRTFGDDAYTYALRKQRGGDSGKKGARYEDFFLAYKVAEIAVASLGQPTPWPHLRGQVFGFVDDAVVQSPVQTEYSQLKNVSSITWTSGKHPLETDFLYQYQLSTELKLPSPITQLIVSNKQLKVELEATIPASIASHTRVLHFPYGDGSKNKLLLESPELQDLLRPLSKKPKPSLADLESVFGVLIIATFSEPHGATVDTLLRTANREQPYQLRCFDVVDLKQYVQPEFEAVLASVPGLSYSFDKGFFSWSAFGTSQTLHTDCTSEEFARFQKRIVQKKSLTFDEFEELLP